MRNRPKIIHGLFFVFLYVLLNTYALGGVPDPYPNSGLVHTKSLMELNKFKLTYFPELLQEYRGGLDRVGLASVAVKMARVYEGQEVAIYHAYAVSKGRPTDWCLFMFYKTTGACTWIGQGRFGGKPWPSEIDEQAKFVFTWINGLHDIGYFMTTMNNKEYFYTNDGNCFGDITAMEKFIASQKLGAIELTETKYPMTILVDGKPYIKNGEYVSGKMTIPTGKHKIKISCAETFYEKFFELNIAKQSISKIQSPSVLAITVNKSSKSGTLIVNDNAINGTNGKTKCVIHLCPEWYHIGVEGDPGSFEMYSISEDRTIEILNLNQRSIREFNKSFISDKFRDKIFNTNKAHVKYRLAANYYYPNKANSKDDFSFLTDNIKVNRAALIPPEFDMDDFGSEFGIGLPVEIKQISLMGTLQDDNVTVSYSNYLEKLWFEVITERIKFFESQQINPKSRLLHIKSPIIVLASIENAKRVMGADDLANPIWGISENYTFYTDSIITLIPSKIQLSPLKTIVKYSVGMFGKNNRLEKHPNFDLEFIFYCPKFILTQLLQQYPDPGIDNTENELFSMKAEELDRHNRWLDKNRDAFFKE